MTSFFVHPSYDRVEFKLYSDILDELNKFLIPDISNIVINYLRKPKDSARVFVSQYEPELFELGFIRQWDISQMRSGKFIAEAEYHKPCHISFLDKPIDLFVKYKTEIGIEGKIYHDHISNHGMLTMKRKFNRIVNNYLVSKYMTVDLFDIDRE